MNNTNIFLINLLILIICCFIIYCIICLCIRLINYKHMLENIESELFGKATFEEFLIIWNDILTKPQYKLINQELYLMNNIGEHFQCMYWSRIETVKCVTVTPEEYLSINCSNYDLIICDNEYNLYDI